MIVGIHSNLTRDKDGRVTRKVLDILKTLAVEVAYSRELADFASDRAKVYEPEKLAKVSDFIIVLGGDGTILRIAHDCANGNAPILPINIGHKGFLAEEDKDHLENYIKDAVNGACDGDVRRLLRVESKGKVFYALNDVVVLHGTRTKLLKAELRVNGTVLERYTSDGLIVATPTGSTAYNLSAGGPVIAPDAEVLVATPICPHSLFTRPIVVKSTGNFTVEILHAEPYARLDVDGEEGVELYAGDSVEITESDKTIKFLRHKNYDFYEKLLNKMYYWSYVDKI